MCSMTSSCCIFDADELTCNCCMSHYTYMYVILTQSLEVDVKEGSGTGTEGGREGGMRDGEREGRRREKQ